MKPYTIEEFHDALKHHEIHLENYYEDLFQEALFQQKRLNAFVTITKDKAFDDLHDLEDHTKLYGVPFVMKDNYDSIQSYAGRLYSYL